MEVVNALGRRKAAVARCLFPLFNTSIHCKATA